jgi:hypothetical protein
MYKYHYVVSSNTKKNNDGSPFLIEVKLSAKDDSEAHQKVMDKYGTEHGLEQMTLHGEYICLDIIEVSRDIIN